MNMICEFPGCNREARFFMGWDNKNGKHFGFVCATCDHRLGRLNLIGAGMSLTEAILFERYLKETVNLLEYPDFPDWLKQPGRHRDVVKVHSDQQAEHSIELLGLSVGVYNALRRNNIITIEELAAVDSAELFRIRTIGKKKLLEIQQKLAEYESG